MAPNIDEQPDLCATEDFMELGFGARSVPDREDRCCLVVALLRSSYRSSSSSIETKRRPIDDDEPSCPVFRHRIRSVSKIDAVATLERWRNHGADYRVLHLSDELAVVELCTCFGEPVDQLESSDPRLLRYLEERRSSPRS